MIKTLVLEQLLPAMAPFIAAGIGWCIVHLARYLAAKVKDQRLATLITQAGEAIDSAVKHVEQTERPLIPGALAGNPGAAAKLKQSALEAAKADMGPAWDSLQKILGLEGDAMLAWAGHRIEAAVYKNGAK